MKNLVVLFILLFCFNSCSNDDDTALADFETSFFTDPRDGQIYQIVKIGNQTWFAENLNYELENNESRCYDDNSINCFTYGRLYRGDDAKTACPQGFHLSSMEEWLELFNYLGGEQTAFAFLSPYAEQQGKEIGFNLLPGGYFFSTYQNLNNGGYFWTSTDGSATNSSLYLEFVPNQLTNFESLPNSGIYLSCRCVKD